MQKRTRTVSACLAILIFYSVAATAERPNKIPEPVKAPPIEQRIAIATVQLPPYIYLDSTHTPQGPLVDILNELSRRSGLAYQLSFMPWARGARELYAGNINALMPTIKTLGREKVFRFMRQPISTLHFSLISSNKTERMTLQSLDTLTGHHFAVLRGASIGEDLDRFLQQEHIKKTQMNSFNSIVKTIAAGRIDHAIIPHLTALHYKKEVNANIHIQKEFLTRQPIYIVLSNKQEATREHILHWEDTLLEMHQDGTIMNIEQQAIERIEKSFISTPSN